MLKKLTFSLFAVLLVTSLTFAGGIKLEKAKKISPDYVNPNAYTVPSKNVSKVTASQLGFTDYDYAGNSTVCEQVWPYDIDGDGVLDPVGTFMQRFEVSEAEGNRRSVMFLGLSGEFTTLDVSDRATYSGWGTVQSITDGPWAGNAAFAYHVGGVSTWTVYNLADFSTAYFAAGSDVADNFPTFAYMDDGNIAMTATDGVMRTTTAADPLTTTEVGTTVFDAGDSEFPIRMSPNGQYLAVVANSDGLGLDPTMKVMLYTSTDGGQSWSEEEIGANTDPVSNRTGYETLFTNFGQKSYAVDNNGTVHVCYNGYAIDTSTPDSGAAYPALYWNSRDRNWIAISDLAEEGSDLDDLYPGNGIGNAYPTPVVSDDGNVVAVLYQAPEFDGGTLNVFPGDGGASSTEMFYTDIKVATSANGGASFNAPVKIAGEPSQSDVYPSAYDFFTVDGNDYTIYYMWMTDAITGCSLFDDNNGASEDSYWSYDEYTFEAIIDGVEDEELATSFSLQQNYPNPFNPSTTIKYSVPQLTDVSVKVYDVLGKEVATLVDAQQAQGVYEVNFDASNLSSGMYIYTINAGSFTSSKKMLLMK